MNIARSMTVVAVLSSIVAAIATQGVTLKRTPKVGDTASYEITGKLSMQGTELGLSGKATEKVTAVEDGTYTVEATQSDLKISVMGQDLSQPDETTKTVYKLGGEIVKIESEKTTPEQYRMENLGLLLFPKDPVVADAEWTGEVKADEKTGTRDAKLKYKYLGEDKVGKYDTYKLTAEGVESGDGGSQIKRTLWISKTDGTIIKDERVLKGVELGAPSPIDGTMTVTRTD